METKNVSYVPNEDYITQLRNLQLSPHIWFTILILISQR